VIARRRPLNGLSGVMIDGAKIRLTANLQRKHPSLPVYVVIPGKVVASWHLSGTTPVEGTANGHSLGRRTIKAWGRGSDDWFVEFTATFCNALNLGVGDSIALVLTLADMSTPPELESALSARKSLQAAWLALTERARRDAGEYVRAAKSPITRQRRATSIVDKLGKQ
jgi:hypothetical protein